MSEGTTGQRVAVVTGAARGIGAAVATRLAADGMAVAVLDLDEAACDATVTAITAAGGRALAVGVDVADREKVAVAVQRVADGLGRPAVLVNNAGIIRDNRVEQISIEDWHAVLDVSLTGSFHCIQAAMPHMKSRKYGRIISFSSMSWRGNFGQANYVAAKAGIVGLTRTVALEGARHGITANAIAPGLIQTPMLASMNGPARDLLIGKVPLKHPGEPEDIAAAAAFLASTEAGYITGVVLDVDGGIGIGSSIR